MSSSGMMSSIVVFLAQLNVLEELAPDKALGKTGGMLVRDILLIVGTLLVLSVILIVWARSASRRSKHRLHRSRSTPRNPPSGEVPGGSREHRHHRHRRQRRDHRGRNPTLDETGGLPPMRSESSSTPSL
jgi:hypothetical protein